MNDNNKNLDDWEWHWQLAIKLAKDDGLPTEEDYWDGLTLKIMSEVQLISDTNSKQELGSISANVGSTV